MRLFSLLSRVLVVLLGYVYPAYSCFKLLESCKSQNRPDVRVAQQLKLWCKYLILMAALQGFQLVADPFIAWIPMYHEAILVFILSLWYDKMQGTEFVYNTYLQPVLSRYEPIIDAHLGEWKAQATASATRCYDALRGHLQQHAVVLAGAAQRQQQLQQQQQHQQQQQQQQQQYLRQAAEGRREAAVDDEGELDYDDTEVLDDYEEVHHGVQAEDPAGGEGLLEGARRGTEQAIGAVSSFFGSLGLRQRVNAAPPR